MTLNVNMDDTIAQCVVRTHNPAVITLVMATLQQKAQCVLWFAEFKLVIKMWHYFWFICRQDPSAKDTINPWYNQFKKLEIWTLKTSQADHTH